MDLTELQKLNKIYPIKIEKYEQYIPDLENGDIVFKINGMVQYLNNIGKLTSNVVSDWNRVMEWVLNDGLTESTSKQVVEYFNSTDFINLVEPALEEVRQETLVELEDIKSGLADTANGLDEKVDLICVGGLEPHPLRNAKEFVDTAEPRILDIFDGYIWADRSGGNLYRMPENGSEWEFVTSSLPSTNAVRRLLKTTDGEVIIIFGSKIFKSIGWNSSNGASSWSEKLTAHGASYYLRESISGNGTKFIAGTYAAGSDYKDSRYVHISLDAGNTWTLVYDSVARYGETTANASHLHSLAYDEYSDRFYVSEGHGTIAGIYTSIDNGTTWNRAPGMILNASPMSITPTKEGLVCGSDHTKTGIFGVVRRPNPMDEELVHVWKWHTGKEGVMGFPTRAFRDTLTDIVYLAFRSEHADVKPIIAAGTPTSGGLIYTWNPGEESTENRVDNVLVTKDRRLMALGMTPNKTVNITGKIMPPGTVTIDEGNIVAGRAPRSDSLAIGFDSLANEGFSVAIGVRAKTNSPIYGTAIGYQAETSGSYAVAIGSDAKAPASSVVIGHNAKTTFTTNVIVGMNGEITGGGGGVALGHGTKGRGNSVAIGLSASNLSGSLDGVAIGKDTVSHNRSVAIGSGVVNTLSDQFSIGKRHIEIGLLDAPPANNTPTTSTRLFARKNNLGKIELCMQIAGVTDPLIVATQA